MTFFCQIIRGPYGHCANPESKQHATPELFSDDKSILDIGCGIGQTLSESGLHEDRLQTEFARVLKPQGRVWLTLHSFEFTRHHLMRSIRDFHFKDVTFRSYVILNGLAFAATGHLFRLPVIRRYESFQACAAIKKCMQKYGFVEIMTRQGKPFVCTARKGML